MDLWWYLIAKKLHLSANSDHLQVITILLKDCHIYAYIARLCWDLIIVTRYNQFIWWEVQCSMTGRMFSWLIFTSTLVFLHTKGITHLRITILSWSPFYQISNLIGGSIKLPSETLYDSLPVVIVDIRSGGSPAPFRHTLHYDKQRKFIVSLW